MYMYIYVYIYIYIYIYLVAEERVRNTNQRHLRPRQPPRPRLRPPRLLHLTTRWSTTLSAKVNLPHAINLRAMRGAHLVK